MEEEYNKEYFEFLYNKIPFYKWYLYKKNKLIEKVVKRYCKKGNLLDIGCGDANLLLYFSKSFNVFGIDISRYIVEEVKKAYPKIKIKVCDIEKDAIPFKEKFDVIFLWNIVEHLKNPEKVLKKIKSYLKKDGYVVIHLPTINNIISKIEYILIWDLLTKEKTHIYRPSIKEFRNMLLSLNYEIIDEYSGQLIPFTLTKNRLIMNSACQYLVIVKKKNE
jgi:2-polyprenyl-3-methyl-5-hydroxy-6-metoxy-1,4-benzoquinol methylase